MYTKRRPSPPKASNKDVALYLARTALARFRKDGYTRWFPSLQNFLKSQNEGSLEITNFSLAGERFSEDLGLTREEYLEFEAAHKAAIESRKLLILSTR
jgi:hypothetical protein